jgi:hypothetical protein
MSWRDMLRHVPSFREATARILPGGATVIPSAAKESLAILQK